MARYWCRRLANHSELVCWLWHCAATAVALKRHERVNAFNLVYVFFACVYVKVTHFVEKPSTFVSTLISCGIYLFSPELFDHIGAVFRRNQEEVTYVMLHTTLATASLLVTVSCIMLIPYI